MKLARGTFLLTFVSVAALSAFGYFFWASPKPWKQSFNSSLPAIKNIPSNNKEVVSRLKLKAALAKEYIAGHGFDRAHCFLLDMRIPSGKKRFFVYNLKKDSVEISGLVTHGSGSGYGPDGLVFSNQPNSYCTSLGKYRVGNSYNGTFGLAYKLYGLEQTNSKAFDRFVVLHSYSCVPDDEVFPYPICVSLGCPTVSPAFLSRLNKYITESRKPVLLWIYY